MICPNTKQMKIIYIYPLLLSIVLISCKKDTITPNEDAFNDSLSEISYSDNPEYQLSNKDAQEYISILERKQKDLKKKLRSARGEEANKLFNEYHKILKELLDSLNMSESKALNEYHLWSDNNLPDSIKKKEKLYDKLGIYFKNEDSTHYSLSFKAGYFYGIFKYRVTSDLNAFLKLKAEDKKNPFMVNDKVEVSWDKIRERLIVWENFIRKYPDSKYMDKAKKTYLDYLNVYLFGTTTMPTFENSSKKILPEREQEYLLMVRKNPKTISGKITKEYLDFLYTNTKAYKSDELFTKAKEHVKTISENYLK